MHDAESKAPVAYLATAYRGGTRTRYFAETERDLAALFSAGTDEPPLDHLEVERVVDTLPSRPKATAASAPRGRR